MKSLLLLLLIAILPTTLLSAAAAEDALTLDSRGLPRWVPVVWTDAPVRIELADRTALAELLDRVPIRGFDREQVRFERGEGGRTRLVFEPRVTGAEKTALRAAGYEVTELPDLLRRGREATEARWLAEARGEIEKDAAALTYPTNDEIGTGLTALAAAYPDLCRVFTWGQSVQGRDLWGVVISDDVQNTEAEPEVRLSSTIHGDEPVGTALLYELAFYLVENYGQSGYEQVTGLVDATEITLIPLHNPDGMALGQRYNANYVDLNRNYPEPAGTHPTQQIENVQFMDFLQDQHFVVGANFHGGALVFNYLWDYTYDLAPDNDACVEMALAYSTYNLPMYEGSFPEGITNGADWYVATGTLQDWTYWATDCFGATVELDNQKWPNESQLPGLWDDNLQSMLHYIETAQFGIHGVVTDFLTGLPVDATITIAGNAKPVHTDPEHGDYYKVLPTGTWDVTITADGYEPQTIQNVTTTWGAATVLDVALGDTTSGTGQIVPRLLIDVGPNPFNPSLRVRFEVPADGRATLRVYDVQGRLVRTLADAVLDQGEHFRDWDGATDSGRQVSSGSYIVRLESGGRETVRKVSLVR